MTNLPVKKIYNKDLNEFLRNPRFMFVHVHNGYVVVDLFTLTCPYFIVYCHSGWQGVENNSMYNPAIPDRFTAKMRVRAQAVEWVNDKIDGLETRVYTSRHVRANIAYMKAYAGTLAYFANKINNKELYINTNKQWFREITPFAIITDARTLPKEITRVPKTPKSKKFTNPNITTPNTPNFLKWSDSYFDVLKANKINFMAERIEGVLELSRQF